MRRADRSVSRQLPGCAKLTGFFRRAPRRSQPIRRALRGGGTVSAFERQQMFSALILLVIALFVAAGFPPAARWRRELRLGAVVAFCAALGWALIEIGRWMAGAR